MKKLVLICSIVVLGLAPVAQAEWSFRSAKNSIASSANYLVKNAWNIAGGACLLTGIGSGATIAYQNTLCPHSNLDIAKAAVVPVALGIGSLLCFNFAERIKKQDELETVKHDVALLKTSLALQNAVNNRTQRELETVLALSEMKIASKDTVRNFENKKIHTQCKQLESSVNHDLHILSKKIEQILHDNRLREENDDTIKAVIKKMQGALTIHQVMVPSHDQTLKNILQQLFRLKGDLALNTSALNKLLSRRVDSLVQKAQDITSIHGKE